MHKASAFCGALEKRTELSNRKDQISLTAEEPLLLDESPGHPEGVLVVGLHPLVHYGPADAERRVGTRAFTSRAATLSSNFPHRMTYGLERL